MDYPRTPTILLIDDDPPIRTLVHDALQDEGYRVVAVRTREDAQTVIGAFRFTLVLTDTMSGARPGEPAFWDGLEALRDAVAGTPVVIFSAHHPGTFDEFAARGFAGVIAKPFELDTLIQTVKQLTKRDEVAG